MAVIHVDLFSKALDRTVPVKVILPADRMSDQHKWLPERKFRTLYLLHGMDGCCNDWLYGTRIMRWAREADLAVVMPSGENAWYVDQEGPLSKFGTFIGEDLVEMTRRMFPLSRKREDTYIAGLSMGGFGALVNGLKYTDTFSRIAILSAAIYFFDIPEMKDDAYVRSLVGDVEKAALTDCNPRVSIENLVQRKQRDASFELPSVFVSCGSSDRLLPDSLRYRDLMIEKGFDVTWEEIPGGHDWDFWDTQIHSVLKWLPQGLAD